MQEVRLLYNEYDNHAAVKAGLKAKFEELYLLSKAIVMICPHKISVKDEVACQDLASNLYLHLSFKIDIRPYELLIGTKAGSQ